MLQVSMKSKLILFTFLMRIAGLLVHDLFYRSKDGCNWCFMLALSFSRGFKKKKCVKNQYIKKEYSPTNNRVCQCKEGNFCQAVFCIKYICVFLINHFNWHLLMMMMTLKPMVTIFTIQPSWHFLWWCHLLSYCCQWSRWQPTRAYGHIQITHLCWQFAKS